MCIRTLEGGHVETVSSLAWLQDGSGFFSAGLDRKIIHWVSRSCFHIECRVWDTAPSSLRTNPPTQNSNGSLKEEWPQAPIRITDMTLTPDGTRLVAVGMDAPASDGTPSRGIESQDGTSGPANPLLSLGSPKGANRLVVFDISSKEPVL